MAYGGGGFIGQNKVLPGAYINFISLSGASAVASDRGTAAIGLTLDWGEEEKIISLTNEEFLRDSLKLFGYRSTDEKLKPIREILKNASKLLLFRLNSGEKSSCSLATAKFSGEAGNNLRIVIEEDIDSDGGYIVYTYFGQNRVDTQMVKAFSELKDSDYIVFKSDGVLQENSGISFTGGTNSDISRDDHQLFLNLLEEYSFDTLGLASDDSALKQHYFAYTKRLRELGCKFQTVLYDCNCDYEGVINVGNKADGENPAAAVYWVTGLSAGMNLNSTAFNKIYDGEYTLCTSFSREELASKINSGVFLIHKSGDSMRVLSDINSLVSFTQDKGKAFCDNRTVRVVDGIAKDTQSLFAEKYMGKIPNNASGRAGLWADIVKMLKSLRDMGAIDDFDNEDITVEVGDDKNSVVITQAVRVTGAMSKLYMTCIIS